MRYVIVIIAYISSVSLLWHLRRFSPVTNRSLNVIYRLLSQVHLQRMSKRGKMCSVTVSASILCDYVFLSIAFHLSELRESSQQIHWMLYPG